MTGEAVAAVAPGKAADEHIVECFTGGRSFVLDADVGAGKTYSLVEGLKKLCAPTVADRLRCGGQQIACITYINVARGQAINRIQGNSLVRVSTIHDFLWSTSQPHQQALRRALFDFNTALPTGSSRRADRAELAVRVAVRLEVKYSDRGSKFLKGRIYHDDLPSIVRIAHTRYDKLARIAASRYPHISIDEYQDISEAVIDILLYRMLLLVDNKFMLGSPGDKMQNIYHHGEHKGIGELPAEPVAPLEVIVRCENRRCSLRAMDMLNNIRTNITQIPGSNDTQGDVAYVRVTAGADEASFQRVRDLLADTLNWDLASQGTREFYLTHWLTVRKAGLADLLQAFTDHGPFAKDALTNSSDRRTALFLEKAEPLALVWRKGQIDETLDRLHGVGHRLASRTAKSGVRDTLNVLTVKRTTGTVREVLEMICDHQLFPLADNLVPRLVNMQPILTAEMDDAAKECEQLEATLYGAFFALPYQQVITLARFFMTSMPFATKHGVKGDEFDTMLVVLDDSGAAWTFYSFDECLSSADETVEPERAKRSCNVLHIHCSRARQRLVVTDLAGTPAAKDERMRTLLELDRYYEAQQHGADP